QVSVVKQFCGEREHRRDKHRADEFCSALDHHSRTNARAEQLSRAHGQSSGKYHLPSRHKKCHRTQVAAEIHYLGVGSRARQVESHHCHKCHCPKHPRTRTEETIVHGDEKNKCHIEDTTTDARWMVLLTHCWTQQRVNRYRT